MPTYKFIYFDGRGAAEIVRLLFKASNTAFEDERLSFDDWKGRKDNFTVSLNKMPILEVDGVQIPQSKAIERYVAKVVGMAGATPIEEAIVDSLCEHKRDVRDSYKKVDDMPKGPEKDAAYEAWFTKDLGEWMAKIEKALPTNDGPFLMGPKVTLADLAWWQFLLDYLDGGGWAGEKEGVAKVLETVPRMKTALDAVGAMPEITAWLSERPKGMF